MISLFSEWINVNYHYTAKKTHHFVASLYAQWIRQGLKQGLKCIVIWEDLKVSLRSSQHNIPVKMSTHLKKKKVEEVIIKFT